MFRSCDASARKTCQERKPLVKLLESFLPLPLKPNSRRLSPDRTIASFPLFLALAALALCLETLTSFGYWCHSPYSEPVRALYESVWYWRRVPRPSDYGWFSLAGYFVDRLKPWTAVMLLGLGAWYLRTKKAPPVR